MIGEIVGIFIFDKIDKSKIEVKEGLLKKDKGLAKDYYANGGKRQISLFSKRGRKKIDQVSGGICIKRFHENISIKNLNLEGLKKGSLLRLGEASIEITEIGKRCFPTCNLLETGKLCPLTEDVIFAKVVEGGVIKYGDKISHV